MEGRKAGQFTRLPRNAIYRATRLLSLATADAGLGMWISGEFDPGAHLCDSERGFRHPSLHREFGFGRNARWSDSSWQTHPQLSSKCAGTRATVLERSGMRTA